MDVIMIRLDKYLADMGVGTRSEVKKYIKQGKISIDGSVVKSADVKVDIDKQKVIYIGDQIFKDILGANRANIPNVLVKYIGYYKKQKIGIKRHLERIILKIYQKNKKAQNRLGGIELEI